MKFSALSIAAFAAANSGTFFCDVVAQETRALKGSKKVGKKSKKEPITETYNLVDEIKDLHASVDREKAKNGYDVFTAIRARHENAVMQPGGADIITDEEKDLLNYGGKIYDGLHTSDFDSLHQIMEGLADPDPEKLLNVISPYLPVDSIEAILPSGRRLSFWSFLTSTVSCVGGAIATGAACTVGEAATAGLDTPACVGAGVGTAGACGSIF